MSRKTVAWEKTMMLLLILAAGLFPSFATESSREKLAALEKSLDNNLAAWEQSLDGSRWEVYKPGRGIKDANFRLRTRFQAPTVFAAVQVTGTPLNLQAKMSARGLVQATFFLDGRELQQATLHGESGTAVEQSSTVPLSDRTDGQEHMLEIVVENRGFDPPRTAYWPERRRGAPADEGSEFYLLSAELIYPAAGKEPGRVAGLAARFPVRRHPAQPGAEALHLHRQTLRHPGQAPGGQGQAGAAQLRLRPGRKRPGPAGTGGGPMAGRAGLDQALAAPGRRRQVLPEGIPHQPGGQRPHRHRLAVAHGRDHGPEQEHLRNGDQEHGRIPRADLRPEPGRHLRLDGKKAPRPVQGDPGKGARRPLGDRGRHVGRARLQPDRRRELGAPAPLRQEVFP